MFKLEGAGGAIISAVSRDAAWALGGSGRVFRWDGKSWQQVEVAVPGAQQLAALAADDVWFFGVGVQRLRAGKLESLPWKGAPVFAPLVLSENDVWAATRGNGGQPQPAHWNGKKWELGTFPGWNYNVAFHRDASGSLWMGAESLFRRVGQKWVKESCPGTDGQCWLAGGTATVAYWHNRVIAAKTQKGWSELPGWDGSSASAVWAFATNDIWVGGQNLLVHWDGKSWSGQRPLTAAEFRAVSGRAGRPVWAVSTDMQTFKFDGQRWVAAGAHRGHCRELALIDAGPAGVWLGCGDELFRWADDDWQKQKSVPNHISSFWQDADGTLYAAGEGVWRRAGNTWEQVVAPRQYHRVRSMVGDGKGKIWFLDEGPRPENSDGPSTGLPDEIFELEKSTARPLKPNGRPSRLGYADGTLWTLGDSWQPPHRWDGKAWIPAAGAPRGDANRESFVTDTPAGAVYLTSAGVWFVRGDQFVADSRHMSGDWITGVWNDGNTLFAVGRDGLLMHATLGP